jgi:poly(ADP-ribose) glycohydrolase ARH3
MNALIVVDLQNDFCPGGALPVPEGDQIVDAVNHLLHRFDLVVATQDWHPADHGSFAANHPGTRPGDAVELAGLRQILWPVHCVQGTPGAELHPKLDASAIARVFRKGTDPTVDSYSGFFDNGHRHSTGLGEFLKERGVTSVYVCGLATDYCVKCTALDAVDLGFKTYLIEDACRGVDLHAGDVWQAIEEMRSKGVIQIRADKCGQDSMESLPTLSDRFQGCMLGLAVGDATGAPYEGLPGDMIFQLGPARSIVETPSGKTRFYTDDTQMAIGVAEALIECCEIREEALCAAFARNYDPARGYGQGARRIIEAIIAGEDWRGIAQRLFPGGSFGNGAAMRVAPVGLMFCDDLDLVSAQAELSASPTHLHPLAVDGARILALAIALATREQRFVRSEYFGELQKRAKTEEFQWQLSVAAQLNSNDTVAGFGNGLEAHRSVVTAICCFAGSPDCYTDTIARAIGQGNDTDTLAAMAGAISGARLGMGAIPSHLVESLENKIKGRTYILQLASKLFHAYESR